MVMQMNVDADLSRKHDFVSEHNLWTWTWMRGCVPGIKRAESQISNFVVGLLLYD